LRTILVILILIVPSYSYGIETFLSSLNLEEKDGIYEARGEVNIKRGDINIRAGHALYNSISDEVLLDGDIVIEAPQFQIKAERAEFNIQTETGSLYNAEVFVREGNYRFRSRIISKEKGMNFYLLDAYLTTCDSPVPEWCFKSRKIRIRPNKDATAKGISFRIKDYPLLYSPYLWVPILTERTSGLLLPTIGFNDSRGVYWRQPLYLVISENRDATLFLDYYSKRGLGTALEYRYIEGFGLEGSTYLFHIRDLKLNKDFYEVVGRNIYSTERSSLRLTLNYVNESEYIRQYKVDIGERTNRFLGSFFETDRRFEHSRLYLRGEYFVELKKDIEQSNVLQRLPEIGYISYPTRLGGISLSYGAGISNFSRDSGTKGQRLNTEISGYHKYGRGITLYQSLALRESFYWLKESDEKDLRHATYTYSAALESRLSSDYGSLRHIVIPSISYRYTKEEGDSTPLFDSTEIRPPMSAVEVSLLNRLYGGGKEFLTFKASEEIDSEKSNTAKFALTLREPITLRAFGSYNIRDGTFGDSTINLGATLKDTSLSIGRQYTKDSDISLYTLGLRYRYSASLSLGTTLWYESEHRDFTNISADIGYRAQCWGTRVSFVRRPNDWSVFLSFELKGLGSFGRSEVNEKSEAL